MKEIRMKKFNLELALAGHPLVTRNGREVRDFKYLPNLSGEPLIASIDGYLKTFLISGSYIEGQIESTDLFLSNVDWQPELKMGDIVQVLTIDGFKNRIFIKKASNGGIICVSHLEEDLFNNNLGFSTFLWKEAEWRRKPKFRDIKIEFTLNGKAFDASELSDESILKLIKESDEK